VIRQNGDTAAGFEPSQDGLDRGFYDIEFTIHLDADGLKGFHGRVAATAARCGRDGVTDHRGKVNCVKQWPVGDDSRRYAPSMLFIGIFAKDSAELEFLIFIDDQRRSESSIGVHPHIQRPRSTVAESALGEVQLVTAHTQVEQDTHKWPRIRVEYLGKRGERCSSYLRTVTEAAEPLGSYGHSGWILVQSQQLNGVVALQQGDRMTGPPGGGIDHEASPHATRSADLCKGVHDLLQHHRHMVEIAGHLLGLPALARPH